MKTVRKVLVWVIIGLLIVGIAVSLFGGEVSVLGSIVAYLAGIVGAIMLEYCLEEYVDKEDCSEDSED